MFESVPGSTANQPNILKPRMPINQKITIRRVLILANTRLHHGRIRQPRHSLSQILTHRLQSSTLTTRSPVSGSNSVPCASIAILNPRPSTFGNCINQIVEVDPRRHRAATETVISRRHTKKDHFLPRYVNQLTQQFRKQFRQPWTTRKHKLSALISFPETSEPASHLRRCDRFLKVFNTVRLRLRHYRLHRASRHQNTGVRFEYSPGRWPSPSCGNRRASSSWSSRSKFALAFVRSLASLRNRDLLAGQPEHPCFHKQCLSLFEQLLPEQSERCDERE